MKIVNMFEMYIEHYQVNSASTDFEIFSIPIKNAYFSYPNVSYRKQRKRKPLPFHIVNCYFLELADAFLLL